MEAEFVACYEATNNALWLQKFYFRTWGCRHHYQAAENLCDNVAAIFLSKNDKYYDGTKHNDLSLCR